jgi:hypothetical protein
MEKLVIACLQLWIVRMGLAGAGAAGQDRPTFLTEDVCARIHRARHGALPPTSPFTGDVGVSGEALTRTIHARGRTGLFDAISADLDATPTAAGLGFRLSRSAFDWFRLVATQPFDEGESHRTNADDSQCYLCRQRTK